MKRKQISIIVPLYNAEQYIERTLLGLLNQSWKDFELLLIDDGSTDNSRQICDSFAKKDSRIKVFHQQNSGASAARNFGIRNASFPYICFLDADDFQDKDYLQTFIDTLDEDDYDIVFQNYVQQDENGEEYSPECETMSAKGTKELSNLFCALDSKACFGWTWNKIFKASIIKEFNLQFREDIALREDELFTIEYYKHIQKAKFVNNASYHYFIYSNSLMRRMHDPVEYARISTIIYQSVQDSFDAENMLQYECKKHFENLRCSFFMGYIYETDKTSRLKVIGQLKSFYKTHETLDIKYNGAFSAAFYKFLFTFCNPQTIDVLMSCWFKAKKLL